MMLASIFSLLFAALSLDGVVGRDLSAQASLDALNVRLGDPLVLTVDFYGSADFTTIHPPALSKAVDAKTWRIDDQSAKTETYRNARRLTYRVRPIREGVIEFPALAFTYPDIDTSETQTVETAAIPVHVRPGSQVALAELEELRTDLPQPDGLFVNLGDSPWGSGDGLTDDRRFAWRKACANPTAEAFQPFDFPEARLNEAACEIQAGNWAKALKIYSRLDWSIGQTPTIERGIVAALALKTGEPSTELPMARQVLRSVLRQNWKGRLLIVLGTLFGLGLLLWLLRRGIRALACVAFVLATAPVLAIDPFGGDIFEQMEQMHRQMDQQMQQMRSAFGAGPGGFSMTMNGRPAPSVEIGVRARVERTDLAVGEPFDVILELEMPKDCSVSELQFEPSQKVGYSLVGNGERLTDGESSNPSNVVRRLAVPIRYDAPFKSRVFFTVAGQWTTRVKQNDGRGHVWNSTFSSSFQKRTVPVVLEVRPPSDANRPDDYSGAVGPVFRLSQQADRRTVGTNDIVTLTCRLNYSGFVPADAIPDAIRESPTSLVFRRYFVANGAPTTDEISFPYYDTNLKDYRRATCAGVPLHYTSEEESAPKTVVVNAAEGTQEQTVVRLRFAPREDAREIGSIDSKAPGLVITERHGAWCRVDDGRRAGWVKKEDLP